MAYIIVGLGNPGDEYEGTRHNTGRMMLDKLASAHDFPDFSVDKKLRALVSKGKIADEATLLVKPETFMNHSGTSVAPLITSLKKAEKLIVVYDDFNLPLGSIRVSFNRSSGGHNGVQSIIKAVKTEAFLRVRVGVAPSKANGLAKVPHGEKEIEKFILSPFRPAEALEIKKVSKLVLGAVETMIKESREKAMSIYNAS